MSSLLIISRYQRFMVPVEQHRGPVRPGQETDSRAIMTLFDGNDLRHRVLNDVKPNDSFSFSFEDMEPFDHTVEFTFPETDDIAFYVEAEEPDVETNSKYYLMSHYKYHPHSSITAGYLNSLANPTTSLTIGYPDFGYYFYHVGSVSERIAAWPEKNDFIISDKSFKSFRATTSSSYIWRRSVFHLNDEANSIYWHVLSSSGQQNFKELPAVIFGEPEVIRSNLRHTSTTFYTQSQPFDAIVERSFLLTPELKGTQLGVTIKSP